MSYYENFLYLDKEKDEESEKTLDIRVEGAHPISGGPAAKRRPEAPIIDQQLRVGFETILAQLEEDPNELSSHIEKLRSLPDCDGILGKLDTYFTEDHWRMAAVLEAYDRPTFEHSLRVAASVYDMTNGGGETENYLRSRITMEEGSLKEFFAAALFHDIGKTAIPQEILHDNHSKREWAKRANEWAAKQGIDPHFDPKKIEELDDVELDRYFMQIRADDKDPLNIIPIGTFFSEETLAELRQHGISPDDTFRKVLECHEKATRAILRSKKMYAASDIASHHHDYDHTPIRLRRNPTEVSAIRIGLELSAQNYAIMIANGLSVLRSMDIYDALISDRGYKKPHHPLIALGVLIKDAEAEFTELELTKHLVRDLYKKLETSGKNIPEEGDEKQKQEAALAKILAFIEA